MIATIGSSSKSARTTKLIAVVGNPNAGKTSLFNALTGSSQKVGNYPGVTVERVSAQMRLGEDTVELVDVPGLYSTEPVSEDEQVAVNVLQGIAEGRPPDLLLCVIDACNIERNLYFFSQLADLGFPIVAAISMTDILAQQGSSIDLAKLRNLLGVDTVIVVGHKRKGLDDLKEVLAKNLADPQPAPNTRSLADPVESKAASLRERFARSGLDYTAEEIRRLLQEPSVEVENDLEELPELLEALHTAREEIGSLNASSSEVADRYRWAKMVQSAVLHTPEAPRRSLTDRLDFILTHRALGLFVFAGIMYLVFQSIYTFAQPLMEWIDGRFGALGDLVGPLFGNEAVRSLVVDGIIGGVGSAIIFLPQILILFFFIAVLEGTGYLARAAFLMDRLLGWAGLNGRAFIPLLSSFACAIPGIMAARVMPDPKSRLATVLVAPLMSCSARLPVYLLMIGAIIEPQFGPAAAGATLFGMHFLGLFVAIPVVWFLNRKVFKRRPLPFLLELPPYQMPKWRDVWLSMYFRAKTFLQTAGTIIVVMSVVIWAALYFPRSEKANEQVRQTYAHSHPRATEAEINSHVAGKQMENSFLGRFGKAIEPAFIPAGFDWRLSTAILSAFPAREVVVASMGVIFNLGEEQDEKSGDLRKAIQDAKWPDGRPLITPWTAVGLMVFFALCCQCMATLATVRRETGTWKWPLFMFVYMTVLAYLFAVGIHQIGLALGY